MKKLLCKSSELQLLGTLNGGQSFRWRKVNLEKETGKETWIGIFNNTVWHLQQEKDCILYQVFGNEKKDNYENMLKNYFRLELDLDHHYKIWSECDQNFKEAAKQFYGIRILNQDVTENLFSFICSSNNNIKRISSMVEKLCTLYGKEICEKNGEKFYAFPNVETLADLKVTETLKQNGFGYRAKFIRESANKIVENGGQEWFKKLRLMDYPEAKKALMDLPGIGAKVADCICLMSLGHLQAIPVDTHIYQIARKFYIPSLPLKNSVNDKIYNQIGDHFRTLYGELGGWAHTVLFCADLKKFKTEPNKTEICNVPKKKSKKK